MHQCISSHFCPCVCLCVLLCVHDQASYAQWTGAHFHGASKAETRLHPQPQPVATPLVGSTWDDPEFLQGQGANPSPAPGTSQPGIWVWPRAQACAIYFELPSSCTHIEAANEAWVCICICRPMCEEMVGECWLQSARVARKAGHHQTAFNALLNGEKTHQAELLTEKAKWLWCKVHQHTHTPHTFILHTIRTII